ncbi:MAG: hypothetical protein Q9190_007830 [Brigantiaea leucoxantha]
MASPGSPRNSILPSTRTNGVKSGRSTPKSPTTKISDPAQSAAGFRSRIQCLANYTEAITDIASCKARLEASRADRDKKLNERSRWGKYHVKFAAFDEEQSRRVKRSELAVDRSVKLLSQSKETGENAMRSLANNIFTPSSGAPASRPGDDHAAKHMSNGIFDVEGRLSILDRSFEDTKTDVEQLKILQVSYQQQIKAELRILEKTLDERGAEIAKTTAKLENITARQDRLEASMKCLQEDADAQRNIVQGLRSDFSNQPNMLQVVESKTDPLERQIEDLKRLHGESNAEQDSAQDLQSSIKSCHGEMKALKTRISEIEKAMQVHTGCVADRREIEHLKEELEQQLSRIKKMETDFNELSNKPQADITETIRELIQNSRLIGSKVEEHDAWLNSFRIELQNCNSQRSVLEQRAYSQSEHKKVTSPGAPPTPQLMQTPIDAGLKDPMDERFAFIEQKISRMKETENVRDEEVSREIEDCCNKLAVQETVIGGFVSDISDLKVEIEGLRVDIGTKTASVMPLEAKTDALASSVEGLSQNLALFGPPSRVQEPPVDNVEVADIQQEVRKLGLDVENVKTSTFDRIHPLEDSYIKMEARWENLTTETMIRSMLHQLQQLYPMHPGNIQQNIASIEIRQLHIEKQMGQLIPMVYKSREDIEKNNIQLGSRLSANEKSVAEILQKVDRLSSCHQANTKAIEEVRGDLKQVVQDLESRKSQHQDMLDRLHEFYSTHKETNDGLQEQSNRLDIVQSNLQDQGSRCDTKHTEVSELDKRVQEIWSNSLSEFANIQGQLTAIQEIQRQQQPKWEPESQELLPDSNQRSHNVHDISDDDEASDVSIRKARVKRHRSLPRQEDRKPRKKRRLYGAFDDDNTSENSEESSQVTTRRSARVIESLNPNQSHSPSTRSRRAGKDRKSTDASVIDGRR